MSAYVIKAVLSSAQHPEYGQVTVPFPVSDEEYDHTVEMLEPLGIGDALRQDCRVDELDSHYSVLKRLEGKSVNLDELDYLAKRLDSFCEGEDAQFQAMAHKLDIVDIKDFINLTFCSQQATVITDFSDLERIGRSHYMNLNGGCASREELENLDQFDFIPGIHTPEEYGRYMIRESGHFEYDENLEGFYDYRSYGEQRIREEGGQFNECGYVAYHGTMALEELMRDDPAEQCQREQGPQMGGLS